MKRLLRSPEVAGLVISLFWAAPHHAQDSHSNPFNSVRSIAQRISHSKLVIPLAKVARMGSGTLFRRATALIQAGWLFHKALLPDPIVYSLKRAGAYKNDYFGISLSQGDASISEALGWPKTRFTELRQAAQLSPSCKFSLAILDTARLSARAGLPGSSIPPSTFSSLLPAIPPHAILVIPPWLQEKPPQQQEAIILHELAHVRHNDMAHEIFMEIGLRLSCFLATRRLCTRYMPQTIQQKFPLLNTAFRATAFFTTDHYWMRPYRKDAWLAEGPGRGIVRKLSHFHEFRADATAAQAGWGRHLADCFTTREEQELEEERRDRQATSRDLQHYLQTAPLAPELAQARDKLELAQACDKFIAQLQLEHRTKQEQYSDHPPLSARIQAIRALVAAAGQQEQQQAHSMGTAGEQPEVPK